MQQQVRATTGCVCFLMLGMPLWSGCANSRNVIERLPDPLLIDATIQQTPPPEPVAAPRATRLDGRKIVVDAGHGGRDPGALSKFAGQADEKHLVLDIARRLADDLRNRGATVVMTRDDDTFLELQERADIAERSRADLFISVHANSARNTAASGTVTYRYTHASNESRAVALATHRAFERNGIESRGVEPGNLYVLREHSRPAVLVETGFLTNAAESRKLNTPSYRARIAAAIAEGVADAIGR